jgi:hypothetical protein
MLKSELFQESYCIFVHDSSFKDYLKDPVKLLKATFRDDLYCIVIPNGMNFKSIEGDLFNLPISKKGFWGQYGMGYLGKTWEVL